jgi:cellulose synthase/poly-beta-1,6-N-acetylglucosamine synthase-like glycosyltransferase
MGRLRLRDIIYILAILTLGLFLAGWTTITYLAILANIRDLPSAFVSVSTGILVGFLILLLVRYLILIWTSFAHHFESLRFDEEMKDKVFTPTVTILVPAHNEGSSIEAAIQSLLEVVYPDLEILVINDGSTDDTLECASRWAGAYRSATVRVIDTGVNVGKAEALNIGLENTTREVVVVMDADSRLEPQSILKGVAHFINPEVVAVAGNVKIINRVNFITKLQTLEYLLGLNLVRRAQGYFQCVNIIPGPMGFFRRDVLLELGGYDSDTYAEDCDLTLKMLARGQRVNYEPDAISWTECPENISGLITQRYRWTRGILQALKKNKTSFFHIKKSGFVNSFMLWYMLFEAIAWPIMNIFGNLFFLFVAGYYGAINLLILWWLILVLLDMTGALHTVTFEEEELSLVFYSIPYRMFFIFGVDITKVLATFEELINVGMSWGSIERRGRTAKK